ncbi:MAG: hypothetical protein BWY22_00698 [Bacteroidetes bacterium ADurb.Bin217]|nr:MAG: hypothetical protein BWY22_00698 [Bacteroidetes bacterium ADurb.Bin217]
MKKLFLFVSVVIIFIASSCSSYDYFPSQQQVLLFKKENDTHFSIGVSPYTTTVTIGHAFSDYVGFVSSAKFLESFQDMNNSDNFLFDNELVIYKRFKNRLMIASNFGYGMGQYRKYDLYNDPYMTRLSRFYIQPSFGFSLKCFDFAVSLRVSQANFDVHSQEMHYDSEESYYSLTPVIKEVTNGYAFFFEPALTIGTGYDWLKFRVQPTTLLSLFDDADGKYILEEPSVNFSVHVTYDFE